MQKKHWRLYWDILIGILVFISGMTIPIGIAIGAQNFAYLTWILAVFFLVDASISFRTHTRLDMHTPKLVSDRSIHFSDRWLWIDLLAAVSLLFIALWWQLPELAGAYAAVLISMLPLLKLAKLHKTFENLQESLHINPSILRLIFFIFWIILAAHLISLGWILIGAVDSALTPHRKYTSALYWSITTLSTVGYGDITPDLNSTPQILFTMLVMLLGVGMYGYIIGNVATLITNLDAAKAHYREKMEEINLFMKTHDIPVPLQERVRNYFRYLWETHKSTTTHAVLDELPHSLSIDIALFLNKNILERVPYFTNADDHFIREIVQMMELIVFLPGDYIIRQGEYGDSMYFLSSGEVEVIIDGQVVVQRGDGTFFGEGALIKNEKRNASIRALTYCDMYRLSRQSFDELRRKYPDFNQHVKEVFSRRE